MKSFFKYLFVIVFLCVPLASVHAGKPVHWVQALQSANSSASRSSFLSDFGIRSSYNLNREVAQQNEHKKIEQFSKESFYKQKHDLDVFKQNYNALNTALRSNKLLSDYMLTAAVMADIHNLSKDEVNFIVRFFTGKVPVRQAKQYEDKTILLSLSYQGADYWFVINPNLKLVTFVYNDPADLGSIAGVKGKATPLSVK